MTDDNIRTRVAPINKYQPFGCMTPVIAAIAALVASASLLLARSSAGTASG